MNSGAAQVTLFVQLVRYMCTVYREEIVVYAWNLVLLNSFSFTKVKVMVISLHSTRTQQHKQPPVQFLLQRTFCLCIYKDRGFYIHWSKQELTFVLKQSPKVGLIVFLDSLWPGMAPLLVFVFAAAILEICDTAGECGDNGNCHNFCFVSVPEIKQEFQVIE